METITIHISNIIGDEFCVCAKEAQMVFERIADAFKNGEKVKLSFSGMKMITAAFLNLSIGKVYKEFPAKEVEDKLQIEDLPACGKIGLKRVIENAKLYKEDPDAMERSMNGILDN